MSIDTLKAAALEVSANEAPPSEKCMDKAELQAVILFPALGTPYIAPTSEKTIKVYMVAEAKCLELFHVQVGQQPKAPLAWYFINTHMRLTAFKDEGKIHADLKGDSLYSSQAAAKAGIKVWYRGSYVAHAGAAKNHWGNQIYDHDGLLVANLRQSAVDFFVAGSAAYGPLAAAHPLDRKLADTSNQPLTHLFEIELSVAGLKTKPAPDKAYTLSWMVTCVYQQAKNGAGQPVLPGVKQWEHQDKLIYDFLWMMKQKKQHFVRPFAFDVSTIKQDDIGKQHTDEANRLKAYHPVMFKNKAALHIGHLTDVHVSSRHFALAKSKVQAIPGVSDAIGARVTNSFVALKELFDNVRKQGADAIFLTGDLIDFNQNFDPTKLSGHAPKDDWALFDLSKQFKQGKAIDGSLYPRGLDDMLAYSLLKYSCQHDCPVFMTVGNHEAYDVPYGIAPRLNGRGIAQTYQQTVELRKKMADREARAAALDEQAAAIERDSDASSAKQAEALRNKAASIRAEREPGEPVAPDNLTATGSTWMADPAARAASMQPAADGARDIGRRVERLFGGSGTGDSPLQQALKSVKQQTDISSNNAYAYSDSRANEGVPADHNLTIYEACMIYGPSYGQLVKAWNFTPSNLDWFFMMFTPLADYQVHFGGSQCFVGLDWGDSEIMINADMTLGEAAQTVARGLDNDAAAHSKVTDQLGNAWESVKTELTGNLTGLPRANKSINRTQQVLLAGALTQGKAKNVLFTHFTLVNYDMPVDYSKESEPFSLDDNSFNEYTKGSFSVRRDWLLGSVVNHGLHFALSGHSHRAGAYRINNRNPAAATVAAYEPAVPGDDAQARTHHHLFSSPSQTRVIVSSCGGPIGMQNVADGMQGWNLRPPSGTLLKTDAAGLDECRRVVAKERQAIPRFSVMLDYLWITKGMPGLGWTPEWISFDARGVQRVDKAKLGYFMLVPNQLRDYVPYIESVDFSAFDNNTKTFKTFSSELSLVRDTQDRVYAQRIADWEGFCETVKSSASSIALARVKFNRSLASKSNYSHYSFDDPWIFPVSVSNQGINRPSGASGEVPSFGWLSKKLSSDFAYLGLPS